MAEELFNISDIDIGGTISRVKSNLVSSCGDYISTEFSFGNVCRSKPAQFIIPLVIIVASIMILKPAWAVDKPAGKYKFVKIAIMSLLIYIVVLFAFMGAYGYFVKSA